MGKWTEFTNEEKETAVKMRKSGKKIKEVAEFLSKPVNVVEGYFKRISLVKKNPNNTKKDRYNNLSPAELMKMMKCYELGMTDQESATECYMSRSTYVKWRLSQGLPPNELTYTKINKKEKTVKTASRL